MPHGLVADLLLGRRAQPELVVTVHMTAQVHPQSTLQLENPSLQAATLHVGLTIENDALVTAHDVGAGLVFWTPRVQASLWTGHLLRSIHATQPEDYGIGAGVAFTLQHEATTSRTPTTIPPFRTERTGINGWMVPLFPYLLPAGATGQATAAQLRGAVEAKAALYLLARDADPRWYQITLRYGNLLQTTEMERHFRSTPCLYERPDVSMRFLKEDEYPFFEAPVD
jgi:hypothetical protein